MNKEYQLDREYSITEIIQWNLRKWWLAVICAVLCAAVLGGYKYKTLVPYLETDAYQDVYQMNAALYVQDYNGAGAQERLSDISQIIQSQQVYELVREKTGYEMTYTEYLGLFDNMNSIDQEPGDVLTVILPYPIWLENVNIEDEASAMAFLSAVIEAADEVSEKLAGQKCFTLLDGPYMTMESQKGMSYFISEEDFNKGVRKGITAGALLGIIVEVVLYTFWLIVWRKPKNVDEVRQCLEAPVIDYVKSNGENEEEIFKKAALFCRKTNGEQNADGRTCTRINCMPVDCPKKDVALKLAMSYANAQKKTLFIELSAGNTGKEAEHSISRYILGEGDRPTAAVMTEYLDMVCRNTADEKHYNLVLNERFAEYLAEKSGEYAYIVINSPDVKDNADAYTVAGLCDTTFAVCARKQVTNETLYRVKNTANAHGIRIEGVLVYER